MLVTDKFTDKFVNLSKGKAESNTEVALHRLAELTPPLYTYTRGVVGFGQRGHPPSTTVGVRGAKSLTALLSVTYCIGIEGRVNG